MLDSNTLNYLTVLFDLVLFYGISTIVGNLMPNPFYAYIKYTISKHIFKITFLNKPELVFFFFFCSFFCSFCVFCCFVGGLHTVKLFPLVSNNLA